MPFIKMNLCRYLMGGARGGGREMRPVGSVPRVKWRMNEKKEEKRRRRKPLEYILSVHQGCKWDTREWFQLFLCPHNHVPSPLQFIPVRVYRPRGCSVEFNRIRFMGIYIFSFSLSRSPLLFFRFLFRSISHGTMQRHTPATGDTETAAC